MPITINDARQKAREVHFGQLADDRKAPGAHVEDQEVVDLLYTSLVETGATRRGRQLVRRASSLWDPRKDAETADKINKMAELGSDAVDSRTARLQAAGLLEAQDDYTAERVGNRRNEVLSRRVAGLVDPQTYILNNFFQTVQADAGDTIGQIQEFVNYVESFGEIEYYQIDPNRGNIRSAEIGSNQYADRINPHMAMYGIKVEYENFLNRVLENLALAEVFAMVTIGWAKASARAREFDASQFLTNQLAPATAFDNGGGASRHGQLTGMGIKGIQNGSLNPTQDVAKLLDFMQNERGMQTDKLIMLLPRDAWPILNGKTGYRHFLDVLGDPMYIRPTMVEGPKGALTDDSRYGIRSAGISYSPKSAVEYLTQSRGAKGARATASMVPGPMPFLPDSIPNWSNEFMIPNSAFGSMKVVLTPHAHAKHRYYPVGHALRNDDVTGQPRRITATDILFFDGNHPMWMIETIPPTSWTATNDEYRKSVLVMVEAYAMANSARGQQAVVVRNAILEDHYTHEPRLDVANIKVTEQPLDGGITEA